MDIYCIETLFSHSWIFFYPKKYFTLTYLLKLYSTFINAVMSRLMRIWGLSLCRKKKKSLKQTSLTVCKISYLVFSSIFCLETSSGHFLMKFTREHESLCSHTRGTERASGWQAALYAVIPKHACTGHL